MTDTNHILVTLSTFGEVSDEPLRRLKQSGIPFTVNPSGKRMTPDEVVELGADSTGLVAGVEPYTAETMDQLPRLKCISRCGVGTDSIEKDAAAERGIAILNTPDAPTTAVAEHTLALMLGLMRRLPRLDGLTRGRKWERVTGSLLAGKTVGIVGFGRIGQRVATLLQPFDVDILTADPVMTAEQAEAVGARLVDMDELLSVSDIVTIHAAPPPEAAPLIGIAEIDAMKHGAWLINTARGGLVDEGAVVDALDSGHLTGAAFDVYEEEPYTGPLCDRDDVILTPHQATLTTETRAAMELGAVENLLEYLEGERGP